MVSHCFLHCGGPIKYLENTPPAPSEKEALIGKLSPELPGAPVLDLFAGAGALGLEALSREAERVVFVEQGRAAALAITNNLRKLGVADQAEVFRCEVRTALNLLAERGDAFRFVLLDPPYRSTVYDSVLTHIDRASLVTDDGSLVVEHHHKRDLHEAYGRLSRTRRVKAGESCLTFYRWA